MAGPWNRLDFRSLDASQQTRLLAAGLTVLTAVIVYVLATQVFPYHTTNHDEGVYLQQAAMLLEGQLYLEPPVTEAFRPWFFVDEPEGLWASYQSGGTGDFLYPKYSPVPAAMFAIGKLLGGYRVALALIGAGLVGLTYGIGAEAFDRRTGLLAGLLLLLSPQFLIDTAVFLPYAPTTFWNLLFGFAYFRADRAVSRTVRRRYAGLAGLAIGIAFFARPYTAVLFAVPFMTHAGWTLWRGWYESSGLPRDTLVRQGLTAGGGTLGVLATLGYNVLVTGSAFLFPYAAFAPHDGLGFGHHEILGYARDYTPELALRVNAEIVWVLFTEWVVAGPLGTALALVGLGTFLLGIWRSRRSATSDRSTVRYVPRAILAGLFVSIIAGNVYFWGNLNILGELADPNDGLIRFLGPYYHFDLLVPTAIFAAHGAITAGSRIQRAVGTSSLTRTRPVLIALLLVSTSIFGGVAATEAQEPIAENHDVTQQLTAAYQPFEQRSLDGALVLLPTPYGDWLNHPFQHLRNDPGYDGDTVYALRENQFEVVDAFPNRTLYRYTYRGQWVPFLGEPVEPRLQPVTTMRGDTITMHATVGVPSGADSVSFRLASEEGHAYYAANGTPARLPFHLVVTNDSRARVAGPVTPSNQTWIPVDDRDELLVTVFVDYGPAGGFSYRFELPTAQESGTVRALTPYLEVCRVPTRCGGEAAYIPNQTDEGVFIESHLTTNKSRTSANATQHRIRQRG